MVRQSTGAGLTAGKALCTVFSTVRRLSAIHLRGADGLQGRERPIGVEGGHHFLPPSTPTCPAYAYRQVDARGWIAELQGYGSSLMENEIHLLRRPAIDSRRNMVAAPDGNDSFPHRTQRTLFRAAPRHGGVPDDFHYPFRQNRKRR